MDINLAIDYLREHEGLVIPYNILIGSYPGGNKTFTNGDEWELYQWNPPEYLPDDYPATDPEASPKPTWETLQDAHWKAELQNKIEEAALVLKSGGVRGETTDYYKREIIIDTGVNESLVETAHNHIIDEYQSRLSKANDTTRTKEERVNDAAALVSYVYSYQARLESWIDALISQDKNR